MPKKEVEALGRAFDKMERESRKQQTQSPEPEEAKTFAIGFSSNDVQLTTRDGTVNVTAKLSKDDFDKVIYTHGLYIMEYLREKGLIKQ